MKRHDTLEKTAFEKNTELENMKMLGWKIISLMQSQIPRNMLSVCTKTRKLYRNESFC